MMKNNEDIIAMKNVRLDLYTLKYVKFMFNLHSDMSSSCNGYHSLCELIEREGNKVLNDNKKTVSLEKNMRSEKEIKQEISNISRHLDDGKLSLDEAKTLLMGLFGLNFKFVEDELPPNDVELLVRDPDGIFHLTSWRPAYNIFTCQERGESTIGWSWRAI